MMSHEDTPGELCLFIYLIVCVNIVSMTFIISAEISPDCGVELFSVYVRKVGR